MHSVMVFADTLVKSFLAMKYRAIDYYFFFFTANLLISSSEKRKSKH